MLAKFEYFQLCLCCFCLVDKVISLNSLIRYFLTPAFSPQLHMMDTVAKPFSPLSLKIELNQCCNPDKNNKNSHRKTPHSWTAAEHCFCYVWASQVTLASLWVFLVFLLKLRYCFGFLNFFFYLLIFGAANMTQHSKYHNFLFSFMSGLICLCVQFKKEGHPWIVLGDTKPQRIPMFTLTYEGRRDNRDFCSQHRGWISHTAIISIRS